MNKLATNASVGNGERRGSCPSSSQSYDSRCVQVIYLPSNVSGLQVRSSFLPKETFSSLGFTVIWLLAIYRFVHSAGTNVMGLNEEISSNLKTSDVGTGLESLNQ